MKNTVVSEICCLISSTLISQRETCALYFSVLTTILEYWSSWFHAHIHTFSTYNQILFSSFCTRANLVVIVAQINSVGCMAMVSADQLLHHPRLGPFLVNLKANLPCCHSKTVIQQLYASPFSLLTWYLETERPAARHLLPDILTTALLLFFCYFSDNGFPEP